MPEKIFGLTLILDFFDRGGIKSSLYLPQAALGFYTPEGEGYFARRVFSAEKSSRFRKETGAFAYSSDTQSRNGSRPA